MKHSVAAFAKGPVVELGPRLLGSTSTEVAKVIVAVLHALTYLPLVLLPVMQDAHLKLVIVLNTSLCLCLLAGNAVFYSMSIVKVFPKMLDTCLLALYASMVPVVFLQFSWLADWINVYHSGAVACFMWLTILLPCWDSFATDALKDRVPEDLWDLPAVKSAGRRVSQFWALAMTLCAIATLPPVLLTERHKWAAVHVVCDYVIVLLLIFLAAAMQWATTARLLAGGSGSSELPRPRQNVDDVELGDGQVDVSVRAWMRAAQQAQQQSSTAAAPVSAAAVVVATDWPPRTHRPRDAESSAADGANSCAAGDRPAWHHAPAAKAACNSSSSSGDSSSSGGGGIITSSSGDCSTSSGAQPA